MPYCTLAEIQERIGPDELIALSDLDKNGSVDVLTVTRARTDAAGYMDSYLQAMYAVPLPAPFPDAIVDIAITLSICRLWQGRDTMDDEHDRVCKAAKDWLMDIANGVILVGLVPLPPSSADKPNVESDAETRQWGRQHFL